MYTNNSYIRSELINSYSWNTAIVFIQKYSGNSNYANKKSVNSSKLYTGKSGDKVCNIHDMASNCSEWSTEYSIWREWNGESYVSQPCVCVGGNYAHNNTKTSSREYYRTTGYWAFQSYRPILYFK